VGAVRGKGEVAMQQQTLYFEKPGKGNTGETLQAARRRAEELGIRQVVLASTHGHTAKEAARIFKGFETRIIAVTICAANQDRGWTMTAEERASVEALGVRVLTGLHSLGDDVNESFEVKGPNRIVRETLYTFCQGMKVAVEVALMAADAGLLDMGSEVIAVAGSDEGADTAVVLQPAYAREFRKLRVREILAKPR
jgi:hypothetical protein